MTALTNRVRAGGFIESEANGFRSRQEVTILGGCGAGATDVYRAGQVLGKITSGGKYIAAAVGAGDGSDSAIAILWDDVDTSNGDVVAAIIARDAEVRLADLTFDPTVDTDNEIATQVASLATVGIIVRS